MVRTRSIQIMKRELGLKSAIAVMGMLIAQIIGHTHPILMLTR